MRAVYRCARSHSRRAFSAWSQLSRAPFTQETQRSRSPAASFRWKLPVAFASARSDLAWGWYSCILRPHSEERMQRSIALTGDLFEDIYGMRVRVEEI